MKPHCQDTLGKILSGVGTLSATAIVLFILLLPLIVLMIPALIFMWYIEVYRPRKMGLVNPPLSCLVANFDKERDKKDDNTSKI